MKKTFTILLCVLISFSTLAQQSYHKSDIVLSEKRSMKDSVKTIPTSGFEFDYPQAGGFSKSVQADGDPVYITPQGTIYLGLAEDMSYYYIMVMGMFPMSITWGFASPFSTWTFKNLTEGSSDFFWEYRDDQVATTRDLVVDVRVEGWYMPTLYSGNQSYQFGTSAPRDNSQMEETQVAIIDAGGGSLISEEDGKQYNVSNACLDYDLVLWQNEETGGYYYGTGGGTEELIAFYDAPATGYIYFEGIDVFFGKCEGPDDAEFRLDIVKGRRGETTVMELGDVIASSTLKIGDIKEDVKALQFRDFIRKTDEGEDEPVNYFELDESFALVLGAIMRLMCNSER